MYKKNSSRLSIFTAMVLFLGMLMCFPARAQNVGSAGGFNMLSNVTTLQTATTNVSNGIVLPVRANQGFSITPKLCLTNSGTPVVGFNLSVSVDKTNWSTTTYPVVVSGNGTTAVIYYSNITANAINNVNWVKIASITNNHTASVFVTNVVLSYF